MIILCQSDNPMEIINTEDITDYELDKKIYKERKRSFKTKEQKIFYRLEKESCRLISYNNYLLANIKDIKQNAKSNHKYANILTKRYFFRSNSTIMNNILYITKSYVNIFIKENKWLSSHLLNELNIFSKDTKHNKKYKHFKETEKFFKKYNTIISELYGIAATAERVYNYDNKFLDRNTFEFILIFIRQFNLAVSPEECIIISIRRCLKYFNELDKTKYRKKDLFCFN